MKNIIFKNGFLTLAIGLSLVLGACSTSELLHEETEVVTTNFKMNRDYMLANVTVDYFDQKDLIKIRDHYKNYGQSPLYIAMGVAHNQTKEDYAATYAKVHNLASRFNNAGLHNTVVSLPEVRESDPRLAVIGYSTQSIALSKECDGQTIPGAKSTTTVEMKNYRLGCSKNRLFLKQLANKEDLKGNAGLGDQNDARRAANVVDTQYRAGETQDFLPGFILSELGGSGE